MKKTLLLSTILAATLTSNVFAYKATLTNKTSVDIMLKVVGKTVMTVSPDSVVSKDLDPYTVYALSYKGEWADQGLGAIQKYTDMAYLITPVDSAPGIADINVDIKADSRRGYVNNVNGPTGGAVYGGICKQDVGGVACMLATSDTLKNLSLSFSPVALKDK